MTTDARCDPVISAIPWRYSSLLIKKDVRLLSIRYAPSIVRMSKVQYDDAFEEPRPLHLEAGQSMQEVAPMMLI